MPNRSLKWSCTLGLQRLPNEETKEDQGRCNDAICNMHNLSLFLKISWRKRLHLCIIPKGHFGATDNVTEVYIFTLTCII